MIKLKKQSSKKILITGVGGDIGQSIISCLKEIDPNFYLIGCDIDNYAAGRSQVKEFFQAPLASKAKEYQDFVKGLINKLGINYVFPATEAEILFYDQHREDFDNDALIFINHSNIISTFIDKYETVNFLKKNGLPYPKTFLLHEYRNKLPFPVLLKPRRGSGGKGQVTVNNEDDLSYYRKKMDYAIVQEIVGNIDEEYTVGVFSTGTKVYSIGFKRSLGYEGVSKVSRLIHDKAIDDLVKKVAILSSLRGLINIQMRKSGRDYIIFEINPRVSSTVYIRHYFGFQDVKWWIDLHEGRSIKYAPKFKEGVAVRNINEVFFDMVASR